MEKVADYLPSKAGLAASLTQGVIVFYIIYLIRHKLYTYPVDMLLISSLR